MTPSSQGRRSSPAYLVVRAADAGPTILTTTVMWLTLRIRWPVVLGIPVDLAFALVWAVTVVALVTTWATSRYSYSADGIVFRSGLTVHRSTTLPWAEAVSFQTTRALAHRLTGCTRVTVGVGSSTRESLLLEAVPVSVAAELERAFDGSRADARSARHEDRATSTGDARPKGHPPSEPEAQVLEGEVVYAIRPRDYLVLSVTYGQLVLLVPFLVGLYGALSDASTLVPAVATWSAGLDLTRVGLSAALAAALPAAVLFGVGVTWGRYRRFEARVGEDAFTMTGGLVSSEHRRVARSQVAGVKVQQNPVMHVTGFARLSLVTRQAGRRVGANVLLPAVRRRHLVQTVQEHLGELSTAVGRPPTVSPRLAQTILAVDAAALVLTCQAIRSWDLLPAGIVLVAVLLALVLVTDRCWVAAEVDLARGTLSAVCGVVRVTHYVVPLEAVHLVETYGVTLRGRRRDLLVCCAIYDSRPVRLWAPCASSTLATDLIAGVIPHGSATPAGARKE